MVLNIVMVGFFGAVAGLLDCESLRKAVADSVPPSFTDLNLRAFDKGYEYGTELLVKLENGDGVEALSLESA
jgi:2-oxoglutarate ferredoxin oxidoreductase subunit gamma